MKATISRSLGYCILDNPSSKVPYLVSSLSMEELNPNEERFALSFVDDWEVIEGNSSSELLDKAKKRSLIKKCVALARLPLILSQRSYDGLIFGYIEELLSSNVSAKDVLQLMVIAPFADPEKLRICANSALTLGFAAIGGFYNQIYDIQPLLRRLVSVWQKLSPEIFLSGEMRKEQWWLYLTESGKLLEILEAKDGRALKAVFGSIAFDLQSPKERAVAASIGYAIAERIFNENSEKQLASQIYDDDRDYRPTGDERPIDSRRELDRALAEIEGILKSLAAGNDYNAERFIEALVERQIRNEDGKEHVIKSLCNIAKQCVDIYRTDYELICLQKALDIDPTDSWLLIQLSDHYKRKAKFDMAETLAARALSYGSGDIGLSLLADIYSQRGEYQRAIDKYKSIPNWQYDAAIRTAIADNFRKRGAIDQARAEYEQIEQDGMLSDRVYAGRANLAKDEGKFDDALLIYKHIFDSYHLSDRAWWMYSISYAGILKQLGRYNEAYRVTEEVISKFPFVLSARVLKSSICGLQDEAIAGLEQLPKYARNTAFGEWVGEYTRGLLLLQTARYRDAQQTLLENLKVSVLEEESRAILRLAAALALIVNGEIKQANELLYAKQAINNAYLIHVNEVFKYHLSIIENDRKKAGELYQSLYRKKDNNIILWSVVEALQAKKIQDAIKVEIQAMLRIAA